MRRFFLAGLGLAVVLYTGAIIAAAIGRDINASAAHACAVKAKYRRTAADSMHYEMWCMK